MAYIGREASSTAREMLHKRERCYIRAREVLHKSRIGGTQERENARTLESANQRLPYSAVSPSTGLTTTASTDEQHLGEGNTKIQKYNKQRHTMFISGRKAGKAYAEKNFYTLKQIPYEKP